MRENKIPPWERERILLIYIENISSQKEKTDDDGNMYHANDEELQKNEKIDEFMTISKYLLSQGPILGT